MKTEIKYAVCFDDKSLSGQYLMSFYTLKAAKEYVKRFNSVKLALAQEYGEVHIEKHTFIMEVIN